MTAGRKRAFDKAEALDTAMHVFWKNGYGGTSIADLTTALRINKPSLYAAFGNKEQLFEAALEHYASRYGAPLMERLTTPDDAPLKERLRSYLFGIVELVSDKNAPKGCLIVKTSCESGSHSFPDEVSSSVEKIGLATEQSLAKFLENEQKRGQLPRSANPRAWAVYLLSIIYGLSVLARHGKSRSEFRTVIDLAIGALPVDRS